jgi:hypothetical protein
MLGADLLALNDAANEMWRKLAALKRRRLIVLAGFPDRRELQTAEFYASDVGLRDLLRIFNERCVLPGGIELNVEDVYETTKGPVDGEVQEVHAGGPAPLRAHAEPDADVGRGKADPCHQAGPGVHG